MRMLGEMSAANPTSGSFSAHADRALGPWAGFARAFPETVIGKASRMRRRLGTL
ncbi:hypothetical protein ACFVN4_34515 [Streptomyces rochei]|uniref:hypothetical protein n=1 Tax=Streptomyces rochei TaxID=1928 RepID=UPI0036A7330A